MESIKAFPNAHEEDSQRNRRPLTLACSAKGTLNPEPQAQTHRGPTVGVPYFGVPLVEIPHDAQHSLRPAPDAALQEDSLRCQLAWPLGLLERGGHPSKGSDTEPQDWGRTLVLAVSRGKTRASASDVQGRSVNLSTSETPLPLRTTSDAGSKHRLLASWAGKGGPTSHSSAGALGTGMGTVVGGLGPARTTGHHEKRPKPWAWKKMPPLLKQAASTLGRGLYA